MSDDKILDLLVGGREYFATHEWNRDGSYFAIRADGHLDLGRCCGVGAVYAAAGCSYESDFEEATGVDGRDINDALYEALAPEQKDATRTFYRFNDRIAESEDEILAVFDRAIEALRSAVSA